MSLNTSVTFPVELDEPRDVPQFPNAVVVVSAQPHNFCERSRCERGTDSAAIVADLIVAFAHFGRGVLGRELAGFVGFTGGSLDARDIEALDGFGFLVRLQLNALRCTSWKI